MDIFVIGDVNTILGFSLIGIEGKIVNRIEDAQNALDEAAENESLKIILITQNWASKMREKVDELKIGKIKPLVLEIPGHKPVDQGSSLRELVEGSLGFKIAKTKRG